MILLFIFSILFYFFFQPDSYFNSVMNCFHFKIKYKKRTLLKLVVAVNIVIFSLLIFLIQLALCSTSRNVGKILVNLTCL